MGWGVVGWVGVEASGGKGGQEGELRPNIRSTAGSATGEVPLLTSASVPCFQQFGENWKSQHKSIYSQLLSHTSSKDS